MARTPKKAATASYDVELIRAAARSRWPEIISHLAGLDASTLTGSHGPCPKCGGSDRFRMIDAEAGALLCNQCFNSKNGDGFAAVQWLLDCKFGPALEKIASYLGIEKTATAPTSSTTTTKKKPKSPPPGYSDLQTAISQMKFWLSKKTVGLVIDPKALGWEYTDAAGKNSFWVVRYNTNQGKRFCPFHQSSTDQLWRSGDPPGLLPLYRLPTLAGDDHIHLFEGEKAAEAAAELGLTTTTSAHGCKSAAKSDWSPLAGRRVTLYPDNDDAGEAYVAEVAARLAALDPPAVVDVKRLPGLPEKGDAYDLIEAQRKAGRSNGEILDFIQSAPAETIESIDAPSNEASDDPHRLARINMEAYAAKSGGGQIRSWRDEWYTWKPSRGCYKKIGAGEFQSKVVQSVKEEFDRINRTEVEAWNAKKRDKELSPKQIDEGPPQTRKISKALINNVVEATKSMTLIPASIEPMTWIDGEKRERRNFVAMRNGLLDLDRLLADNDADGLADILLPHSPNWFSTVCLPYKYDPNAKLERWWNFVSNNLAGNQAVIATLQEWLGYLLTADTGYQKFLLMKGEGSNGKSVFFAAITAMLGQENISNISLDVFGDRFSRSETLGKLANIAGDCEELDKVAEGYIKGFTSGDRMFFDRKGISGINCVPTARLMVSCNELPKIKDRSQGIWRRMLLIDWQVVIADGRKIRNMDKAEWWEASGELPGIFNWAVQGLGRLRKQGHFTESAESKNAIIEYQRDSNSAKHFLTEFITEVGAGDADFIRTNEIYRLYVLWAREAGLYPLARNTFGKEIGRTFKKARRDRKRDKETKDLHWVYSKIKWTAKKINGQLTDDAMALADFTDPDHDPGETEKQLFM